ncbi:MAG TPA: SIMPL domain-containing protein [Gaiellaceae bacterium]|nr:SIMPL domain-containing protein [Gaiellaceae bacterium]
MRHVATTAAALAVVVVLAAGCMGDDEGADIAAVGGLESGVLAADATAESLAAAGAAVSAGGITVVGTGTATVAPDTATWSFGVQTSADTAEAALAANSTAMEQVVAALKSAGIADDDLQTEQVSVYPRTSDDGISIVGYDASNTVRATIRNLDEAGAIVDAAVAAGANQVYGPSLTVSDTEAQYRVAVEAAFADARTRAEAIAELAGVTLGAPVAIVEGGGGGPVPYYGGAAMEAAAADVAVEPGTQDVGASLTVTFAIE